MEHIIGRELPRFNRLKMVNAANSRAGLPNNKQRNWLPVLKL
jgi:hypothetical protein